MPYHEQPLDLLHKPAQYASHNYTGTGEWTTLRTTDKDPVGVLSWNSDPLVLNWFSVLAPDDPGASYRTRIETALRAMADAGVPARQARDTLLGVGHDEPKTGDLADLRRELMW